MKRTKTSCRRITAYVPDEIAERLDKYLERQYGPRPPYGVVTSLLNRLLLEYLEAAERRR